MNLRKAHRQLAALLACAVLLQLSAGCARLHAVEDGRLRVVATTCPVYALAAAVCAGVDGVQLDRLGTGQVSCLHDYTLTVSDARRLEQADLLLLNGAGLEEFLSSALSGLDTPAVDCSAGIVLLDAEQGAHRHDQEEEELAHDPHFWMDPRNARKMTAAIADALARADPEHEALYNQNMQIVCDCLFEAWLRWSAELSGLSCPYLVTFHDGFRYFAGAFGLTLLFAMEEEDGATASAKDIRTATELVRRYELPAVFMEQNGSGSAAGAVAQETGCAVASLSMLMDGPDAPAGAGALEILSELYLSPMGQNVAILQEVLQ